MVQSVEAPNSETKVTFSNGAQTGSVNPEEGTKLVTTLNMY